jgi:hypothetical protein
MIHRFDRLQPWGKLDRAHPDPTQAPRLSLVGHCIDVAAVARCSQNWV